MDMRNGNIYSDLEAALAAGVPPEHAVGVQPEGDLLRITSGPFKGRTYRRTATGIARVDEPAPRPNYRGVVVEEDGNGNLIEIDPAKGGE